MNCSTPGLPVHHQLPELTQTHDHWVGDAIQPSHPLSPPFPLTLNLSQYPIKSFHLLKMKQQLIRDSEYHFPGLLGNCTKIRYSVAELVRNRWRKFRARWWVQVLPSSSWGSLRDTLSFLELLSVKWRQSSKSIVSRYSQHLVSWHYKPSAFWDGHGSFSIYSITDESHFQIPSQHVSVEIRGILWQSSG